MWRALAHPEQPLGHVQVRVAGAAEAAFGVEADDVGDRPTDLDQPFRILEQLQVAVVPGHQAQRLVDHADALGDVLDGALQQRAVELQHLGGFVGDLHHVLHLHLAAFDGGLHHRAGGGGAEHAGEQAFGVGDPFDGGVLRGHETLALLVGEAREALPRALLADEAGGQHQQVFQLHGEHRARADPRRDFLADEAAGLPVLGNPRAGEHRDQAEQREVADQRDQHAEGQRLDGQRRMGQPGQAGNVFQRPAQPAGDHRQHQGVGPQQRTGGQPGEHAAAVGLFPVQRADHRRAELGDGGEGDLADGGEAGAGAEQAVADVGQQHDQHDADPAHGEQPVAEHLERLGLLAAGAAQQPGQQHVVGNHGRQRHAGDDDHAGGGRGAADEGQQRQRRMRLGQRQADHEGVRHDSGGQVQLAGEGDRHDEQRGQHQVGGKHPARQVEVAWLDVFHHGDVELPWQAHDRGHRHAGLQQHRRPVHGVLPVFLELRCVTRFFQQVAEAVVETEGDEDADGEEGRQLDQRFEGDGQHHAAVVFGDVQAARAEDDGEQREDQRHQQRRVLRADTGGVGAGADQQVHAEDDALQLQGDVGQHADHADQRHHHGERLRLAVARGDEVGDGGDVLLLADQDHLLQHPGREQHQQHRPEVDRQERPELPGGLADRAKEGPTGAVHRQRQAIDPGSQTRRQRRTAAVAIEGDGEQDGHVEEGDRGDQPAGQRHVNSGIACPHARELG
ncbi:hypothetical protein D3C76_632490 [compost metagenome]